MRSLCFHIWFSHRLLTVLFVIAVGLVFVDDRGNAQDIPPPSRPTTVPLRPPPSPQERLLSPVPQQFDWMRRESPSNPLLESIIGPQGTETRLSFALTLSGEYSDNFRAGGNRLEGEESEDNIRTALTLGTLYRRERMQEERTQSFVSLANTVSANYDTSNENAEIGFTNFSLNTGYAWPRVAFAVSDNLILDDDQFRFTQGLESGRRRFLTNNFSPQMNYSLSRLSSITAGYTNRVVVDLEDNRIDSISHSISPGLLYRFSRRITGSVSYRLRYIDQYSGENDGLSHNIDTSLGWVFSASTDFLFGLGVLLREDSTSVRLSVGVNRQLSPNWTLFVSAGPSYVSRTTQDAGIEDETQDIVANWNVSLSGKIAAQTSLALTTAQSIDDTSGDLSDQGLVLRSTAALSLSHTLFDNLHSALSINYGRNDPLEDSASNTTSQSQDDQFVIASLSGTYGFTPTLLLSLRYQYERRFSDNEADDFQRNRILLALSATF